MAASTAPACAKDVLPRRKQVQTRSSVRPLVHSILPVFRVLCWEVTRTCRGDIHSPSTHPPPQHLTIMCGRWIPQGGGNKPTMVHIFWRDPRRNMHHQCLSRLPSSTTPHSVNVEVRHRERKGAPTVSVLGTLAGAMSHAFCLVFPEAEMTCEMSVRFLRGDLPHEAAILDREARKETLPSSAI